MQLRKISAEPHHCDRCVPFGVSGMAEYPRARWSNWICTLQEYNVALQNDRSALETLLGLATLFHHCLFGNPIRGTFPELRGTHPEHCGSYPKLRAFSL